MTVWRTCYRGADDKGIHRDHPTEREAEQHAKSLVMRQVVKGPDLVYVYAVEIEESDL